MSEITRLFFIRNSPFERMKKATPCHHLNHIKIDYQRTKSPMRLLGGTTSLSVGIQLITCVKFSGNVFLTAIAIKNVQYLQYSNYNLLKTYFQN